jgi:hypothetical protein
MTSLHKYIFILVISMLSFCSSEAQPGSGGGGGPGGGGGGNPGGGNPVPITGIEILIGAGGAYGLRKLMKRKKP